MARLNRCPLVEATDLKPPPTFLVLERESVYSTVLGYPLLTDRTSDGALVADMARHPAANDPM